MNEYPLQDPPPDDFAQAPAANTHPDPTNYVCLTCGYDLSGTAVGGQCPECGAPVTHSLATGIPLPTSGKAIASMVLGICSIVLCMCYGLPGIIAGGVGLLMFYLARPDIRDGRVNSASSGMATAGLVTSIIGVALGVIYLGFFVVMIAINGF